MNCGAVWEWLHVVETLATNLKAVIPTSVSIKVSGKTVRNSLRDGGVSPFHPSVRRVR